MRARITPQQAKALGIPGAKGKPKARERRLKAPPPRPVPPARMLALDPSSTAVGWAVFVGGELRHVGVLRSSSSCPRERARKLAEGAAWLVLDHQPGVIAMEIVSGMHRRARSLSVATCAFGQGAVWAAIDRLLDGDERPRIVCIKENQWTSGTPKKKRAELIRLTQPVYAEFARKDGDRGLDAADAVGLALFHLGGCR